jgi:hypothetical protein
LSASDLSALVQDFLDGSWAGGSTRFVLCTTHDLSGRRLQKAIVSERERLADRGILFQPWGKDALLLELKSHPLIVYDFFGESLARRFSGDLLIDGLSHRLGPDDLRTLRGRLREFYERIFELDDPRRGEFVNLDVREGREVVGSGDRGSPSGASGLLDEPLTNIVRDVLASPSLPLPPASSPVDDRSYPIMEWVAREGSRLAIGGPGSGKSTFLRVLALDVLSNSPRFGAAATAFGTHVPVWIPFSRWVRAIANEPGREWSVETLVQQWLESLGVNDLWPLIQRGLEDDRVLLLVDGLDEFTDDGAAEHALKSLVLRADRRPCGVIAAGRPSAMARLELRRLEWDFADISPLSVPQQRELAAGVISQERGRQAHRSVEQFMTELSARQELAEPATTPLLMNYLVRLWLERRTLPATRVEAFGQIVRLILEVHPRRRRRIAEEPPPDPQLNEQEREDATSVLALSVQASEGFALSHSEAERVIVQYLSSSSGPALDRTTARLAGRELVRDLLDTYGLLVRVTEADVSFVHSTIREYLGARALAVQDRDQLRVELRQHAVDAGWYEVFRHLLGLCDRNLSDDLVQDLVSALTERPELFALELFLAEAASTADLTEDTAQAILKSAIHKVEEQEWSPNQVGLIRAVVRALGHPGLREVAQEAVSRWFPYRYGWPATGLRAIARWTSNEELVAVFLRGLRQTDTTARQVAAALLGELGGSSLFPADKLSLMAAKDQSPDARAAALFALSLGLPDQAEPLLQLARQSDVPQLALVVALAEARNGVRRADQLQLLLEVARETSGVDAAWWGLAHQAVVEGWSGDAHLRDQLLGLYRDRQGPRRTQEIDENFLVVTLLSAFPGDAKVAAVVAEELATEHPFISFMMGVDPWKLLAENFRDDPVVAPAVDAWLTTCNSAHLVEASYAALVGRTAVAKDFLLMHVEDSMPYWSALALLDGWGMSDPQVAGVLRGLATDEAGRSSLIGPLLPRVLGSSHEARLRLMACLADPACSRPDLVLDGLAEVGIDPNDTAVADQVFQRLEQGQAEGFGLRARVISYLHGDPRTRELAVSEIAKPDGAWEAVASAYEMDAVLRRAILESLTPLDAPGRAVLVDALAAGLGVPSDGKEQSLGRYAAEYEADISTAAAVSYFEMLAATQGVPGMRPVLAEGLAATGTNYERRSQAAFAAALALGIPDVVLDASHDWREDKRVAVPITDFLRPNLPLLRLVLQHWDELKTLFGDEFWFRLDGHRTGGPAELWKVLVSVADEYPGPREEALEFLRATGPERPPYHQSPEVLSFIARCLPQSVLLRDFCLATVLPEHIDLGGWRGAEFAAELLGTHFRGDEEVLRQLTEAANAEFSLPPGWFPLSSGVLCALGEGWTNAEGLNTAWAWRGTDHVPGLPDGAWAHVVCSCAGRDDLIGWMTSQVHEAVITDAPSVRARRRALRGRIQRDVEVRRALVEMVMAPTTPCSLRVSTLSLLRGIAASEEGLRTYTGDLLSRELARDTPSSEIGFDLARGSWRGMAAVLGELVRDETPSEAGGATAVNPRPDRGANPVRVGSPEHPHVLRLEAGNNGEPSP